MTNTFSSMIKDIADAVFTMSLRIFTCGFSFWLFWNYAAPDFNLPILSYFKACAVVGVTYTIGWINSYHKE